MILRQSPCAEAAEKKHYGSDSTFWSHSVPTLTRLLIVLALLGAAGYGLVYSLATFVEPREREITVRVKKEGFGR